MIQWLVHKKNRCFQYGMQMYYIFQLHERTIEWLLWNGHVSFMNKSVLLNKLVERKIHGLKRHSLVATYWCMVNVKYVH